MLEALDVGDEPAVVRKKRRARLELAVHQRRTHEDLVARRGIEPSIVDPAAGVHPKPVERSGLDGNNLPPAFLPVRIDAVALEEVTAELLKPARLDRAYRPRIEPRRLDQLRRDDPFAGLARPRARVHA